MAKNDTYLEEAFRKAFESHEMDVRPQVWNAIQGSIAGGTGVATSGGDFLGKAAAVVGFAGLITAATIAEIDYHSQETPAATIVNVEATEAIESSESETSTVVVTSTTESAVQSSTSADQAVSSSPDIVSTGVEESNDQELQAATSENTPIHSDILTDNGPNDEKNDVLEEEGGSNGETNPNEDATAIANTPSDRQASEEAAQETPAPAPTKSQVADFSHPAKQIITPNGDARNDYLLIEGYGVKEFYLVVMAQNGQPVFESNDPNVKWNGTDRMGNALPAGQYFYKIVAVGNDDLPYVAPNAKGSVQIIR